ncbi:hypothetical protein TD95_002324 [Thielaviopsis punctulata]|uniref:Uncharacterized protein n=1 Tax=Thielaviopsis punctulata TaxID=72032 RepID=A0A0F4ZCY1_9PEZI|nr:hypothetical protein TD95_002324 [Thielaviopsis punctulata]
MDEALFDLTIETCTYVSEKTQYLEIFNFEGSDTPHVATHALDIADFDNFLCCKGVFSPQDKFSPEHRGKTPSSGIRLVMQNSAQQPATFTSKHISLPPADFKKMVKIFNLPMKSIEATCTVGPLFWTALQGQGEKRCFQIMCRKSDVLKKKMTRGWELMLSYNMHTRITSGYLKTTDSANPHEIMRLLQHASTISSLGHPFTLPMLIISINELSSENEDRQRQAREMLRHLENAIAGRDDAEAKTDHMIVEGWLNMEQINRDLCECVCKVLWKRPRTYLAMLEHVDKGLKAWWDAAGERVKQDDVLKDLQESMLARVQFHSAKLKGIDSYAWTSLERLRVQRESAQMFNIIAQRESKLNLEMAKEQKRIADISKRDGTTMKTLSLLGALFLPGTFLSSIFSMTFFNYQDDSAPAMSSKIWVYFAITIPLTIVVLLLWLAYEAWRKKQYAEQDKAVDEDWVRLEQKIMSDLRHKTMKTTTTLPTKPTWNQHEKEASTETSEASGLWHHGGLVVKKSLDRLYNMV